MGGFLRPISSKITLSTEKKWRKRTKSEEKREKAMYGCSLNQLYFGNEKEAFEKTSGTISKDRGKNWPIADRRVPSSDPRNNSGTQLGSSPLLVCKVAMSPKKSGCVRRNIAKKKRKPIAVQPALLFYCLFTTMKFADQIQQDPHLCFVC